MNHAGFEDLWLELSEGTLPHDQASALRSHVDACPECGPRYRRLEAVHRSSGEAGRALRAADTRVPPHAVADAIRTVASERLMNTRLVASVRLGASQPPLQTAYSTANKRRQWPTLAFLGGAFAIALVASTVERVKPISRQRVAPPATPNAAVPEREPSVRRALDALDALPNTAAAKAEVRRVAERWRTDDLHLRTAAVRCAHGIQMVDALVDDAGGIALLVRNMGVDRIDVHLYAKDGSVLTTTRLQPDSRVAVRTGAANDRANEIIPASLAPPPRITQFQARAILAVPVCELGDDP